MEAKRQGQVDVFGLILKFVGKPAGDGQAARACSEQWQEDEAFVYAVADKEEIAIFLF